MTSKSKSPEMVTDPSVADYYRQHSTRFVAEGKTKIGYRYDQIEGRKLQKPNGVNFTNNVTLSQPSSEVLTLIKQDGEWFFVFGLQSRSPYLVNVSGKLYCKLFLEQAAGLLEEDQDFVQAAIAETSQEFGVTLSYLGVLISKVCRHVSYSDETSVVFLAIADSIGKQRLDKYENIQVVLFHIYETRKELEAYLGGNKENFFGFDIPEMTLLSLSRFFWKYDTGLLDLNDLHGNLLKK